MQREPRLTFPELPGYVRPTFDRRPLGEISETTALQSSGRYRGQHRILRSACFEKSCGAGLSLVHGGRVFEIKITERECASCRIPACNPILISQRVRIPKLAVLAP